MAAIYDRFPLKFKLPEQNGGILTELDVFPGMVYYSTDSDILINNTFSSVFSNNFNIFNVSIAPRLVRYVPSSNSFLATYYKGVYLYNPSIENDLVSHECTRSNINFSITGGSSFVLTDASTVYYEGSFYQNNLNSPNERSGLDRTSANNNIKVSISPTKLKNEPLKYFEINGFSPSGGITSRDYLPGNLGVSILSLEPGEYFGFYLKFEVSFSINSKPIDYCFLNLTYDNVVNPENELFPARESIPGLSVQTLAEKDYYNQSFALKFETSLNSLKRRIQRNVDVMYDNFPPFFSDYRDEEDLS